jgi:hypothetical protein
MGKVNSIHSIIALCCVLEVNYILHGKSWGGGSTRIVLDQRGVVEGPCNQRLQLDEELGGHPSYDNGGQGGREGGQRMVDPILTHHRRLPLEELVATSNATASDCGPQLWFMDDVVAPVDANVWGRKIPKIVHITGKTRCLPLPFLENVNQWKLQNHSFYFHDDAAVDRLLRQEYWPEFPQLSMLRPCLISGAGKADLWRYLLLYRYGGIYTDMDTAPGVKFFAPHDNASTIISADDDSFFVVERIGVLSQYFMAASPRHPLLYLSVLQVFHRLLEVDSVGGQYVPYVTGPGALKNAFIRFMGGSADGYVEAGRYVGHENRSVTVVGARRTGDDFVRRNPMRPKVKGNGYALMGMKHFSSAQEEARNLSCFLTLYNEAANTTQQ